MPTKKDITPCSKCAAKTKRGSPCKLKTCKWSPYCHLHSPVDLRQSTIPNAGTGVYASRDIKKDTKVADYTVGTKPMAKAQLNAAYPGDTTATHVWGKNQNLFYDALPTVSNSIAGMFNTCRAVNKRRGECKGNNTKVTHTGAIKTTKNVRKDEELFYGYGRDYRFSNE